jgi:hypothetical protein
LSKWFLFLSSFVFPLLFRHCFISVFFAHVVSSLAYPTCLGLKGLVVVVIIVHVEMLVQAFLFTMKVIAAYLLAVLGGKTSPTADDVKNIMESGIRSSFFFF